MKNLLPSMLLIAQSAVFISFVLWKPNAQEKSDHLTVTKISIKDKDGRIVGELDGGHLGGPELRLGSIELNGKQAWSVILSGSRFRGPGLRIKDHSKPKISEHIYLGLSGRPADPLFELYDQRSDEFFRLTSGSPQGGLIMQKLTESGKELWSDKMRDE